MIPSFWKGIFLVVASPVVGVFLGWLCAFSILLLDTILPDVFPGVSKVTPQQERDALMKYGSWVGFVTMIAIFIKGIFTMFE